MSLDTAILDALNPNGQIAGLDQLMLVLSTIGYSFILALAFFPLWLKRKRCEALNLLLALLASEALVYRLKDSIMRLRPAGVNMELANQVIFPIAKYSFPSGHAASAFLFAVFLSLVYWRGRRRLEVPVALNLFAAGVCVSRVYVGVHYPSDVLAGAIIGVALGWSFFKLMDYPLYRDRIDRLLSRRKR